MTYLTTEDIAERLKVSPATVAIWFCTHRIRAKKIGKRWFTTEEHLKEAMDL